MTPSAVGTDTVTATDKTSGASGNVTLDVVGALVVSQFFLLPLTRAVAGSPTSVAVISLDASNHMVTSYTGTVQLSSTDAADKLPNAYAFQVSDHGFHVFTLTPAAAGNDAVTATDTVSVVKGSVTLDVVAAPVVTHFFIWVPSRDYAGTATNVTVFALDASNRIVQNYAGTVQLSSSATGDTLPASYSFQGSDHGAHTFTVTPAAVGNDTITATDTTSAITGSTVLKVASAPVATQLYVWVLPRASVEGPTLVDVVALDASNHVVPNYTGTVQLSSSDAAVSLPNAYTFQAQDHGFHVFTLTFATAGRQTITATDSTNHLSDTVTVHVGQSPPHWFGD